MSEVRVAKMAADPQDSLVELIREAARLHGRFLSVAWPACVEEGLTSPAQSMVLDAVIRAAEPPTVPRIGRSLGHSRQAIQRIADDLARAGLVRFVDNAQHKTAKLVAPTAAGHAMQARIADRMGGWIVRLAEGLPAGHLEEAVATLRTVRAGIEDEVRAGQKLKVTRSDLQRKGV
ncbi:MAG: MarR family transcriptional regulator [Caulobacteraceae bacterium]|nr:MarR family transcriptional regulator [Caulobacteraceae bacterium]